VRFLPGRVEGVSIFNANGFSFELDSFDDGYNGPVYPGRTVTGHLEGGGLKASCDVEEFCFLKGSSRYRLFLCLADGRLFSCYLP